jgi:hypothetical protein
MGYKKEIGRGYRITQMVFLSPFFSFDMLPCGET